MLLLLPPLQSGAHSTKASPEDRPPLRPSSQQDNRAHEPRLGGQPCKLAELSAVAAAAAAADEGRQQHLEAAPAPAAESDEGEEDGGDAAEGGGGAQPLATQSCDVEAALEALGAVVARACSGSQAEDGEVELLVGEAEEDGMAAGEVSGWVVGCGLGACGGRGLALDRAWGAEGGCRVPAWCFAGPAAGRLTGRLPCSACALLTSRLRAPLRRPTLPQSADDTGLHGRKRSFTEITQGSLPLAPGGCRRRALGGGHGWVCKGDGVRERCSCPLQAALAGA